MQRPQYDNIFPINKEIGVLIDACDKRKNLRLFVQGTGLSVASKETLKNALNIENNERIIFVEEDWDHADKILIQEGGWC